jgi:hypothetical protein
LHVSSSSFAGVHSIALAILRITAKEDWRLTEEDVFYNNNQNAFIIDAKTVEATKGQGRLMLECVWTEPTPGGGTSALHRKTVGFDDLTLRPEKQLAYYFDYAGRKAALASAKESEAQSLRDEIEAWWGSGGPRGPDGHLQWARFATRLRQLGVQVRRAAKYEAEQSVRNRAEGTAFWFKGVMAF